MHQQRSQVPDLHDVPLTKDMERFIIRAVDKYPHGRIPRDGIAELGGNHRTWEGMEGRGYATVTDNAIFLKAPALQLARQRRQASLTRRSAQHRRRAAS